MNTSFLDISNESNKPNMACNINLLKINFENSINLGGENTHLNSTLKDSI